MIIKSITAICLFIALSAPLACAAVTDLIALNEKFCRPAPSALLQPLPSGWLEGGRYIHLCPVFGKNRQPILYILTPRIDLASHDLPFVENLIKTHRGMTRTTLVLNTDYVTIGELPGTFPYDPPDLFEVTFTDWHGDFPYRIEFYVPASDMHGPEHPNPLYWNPRIRKFQDSPP